MNKRKIFTFTIIILLLISIMSLLSIFINFLSSRSNNNIIGEFFSYSSYIKSNWDIIVPEPQKKDIILSELGTGSGLSQLEFSNKDYEKFKNSIEWMDSGHQSEYFIDNFIKYISSVPVEQKQSGKEKWILFLQNLNKTKDYKFYYKINTNGYLYFILINNKPNIIYSISVTSR